MPKQAYKYKLPVQRRAINGDAGVSRVQTIIVGCTERHLIVLHPRRIRALHITGSTVDLNKRRVV